MSPLRASVPSSIHTLRFTTSKSIFSGPTTIGHAFHTSTSTKSSSPLFHLAALSNSRESSHFRKASKLSQVEHSPALQLIRSSEVEPFGAPKDIKSSDEKKTTTQARTPPLRSQASSEDNNVKSESLPLKSQSVWSEADLAKMKEMTRGGLPVSSIPEEWSKGQLAKIEELSAGEKVILRELLKRDARFASREAMMNEQANGLGKVAAQEVGRLAEIFFPSTHKDLLAAGWTRVDTAEDARVDEEGDAEPWKHFGISKAEYMALQTLEEGGGSRARKQQEKLTRASPRPETTTNPMDTPDEKLWGPEATPTSPAVSDGEWMANVMQFRKLPTDEPQSSQPNVRNAYPGQPLFSTNSSQKESEKTGSITTRWVIIGSILTGLLVWNVRPAEPSATKFAQSAKAAQTQSADPSKARADEPTLADYQVQLMLLEQENKRRLLQARLESEKDIAARKALAKDKDDTKVVASSKGWFWE